MSYDLVVIGGGPGGYVAAIRAGQLGKKVACVEAERAGGTCLNWGCIPTKALLKNAHLFHTLQHGVKEFGIAFDNLSYDWEAVIGRSRNVSDRLAGGVEFLFKKNKVEHLQGFGRLKGKGGVEMTNDDLDLCHGHEHGTLGYHYHATIEYPYTVGCYIGIPIKNSSDPTTSRDGRPPRMRK